MSIARKVAECLATAGVEYKVVTHEASESSSRSAGSSHVKGSQVAKTVVLHDGERYLLGVVPSTHRVELNTLGEILGKRLTLATESEAARLFDDCELGADPPLGHAYGLLVYVDEALLENDEVLFEGGDHRSLISVSAASFRKLLEGAGHKTFSHHV